MVFGVIIPIMLLGEYLHILDSKKRLALPSRFRVKLGKRVVLTQGLDKCLFLYGLKEWERIADKIASLPMGKADSRGFNRFMLAGACETEVDTAGRILVPEFLKTFADLSEKVVLIGVHSRAEIWDEKTWNDYKKQVASKADALAEKLGEIGVI